MPRPTVNHAFFQRWSPEMAYVLGYVCADGCLIKNKRGSCYLELTSVDRELIDQVREALNATQKISERRRSASWQPAFTLQIGSKRIFQDLLRLGLRMRKSRRLTLPDVPKPLLGDFVRGYFDGDGNVTLAEFARTQRGGKRGRWLRVTFTSASQPFLDDLRRRLATTVGLRAGNMVQEEGFARLRYYQKADIDSLFKFMYSGPPKLYLTRKYEYYQAALKAMVR